jgi:biopolymer transport protein ExbB
MAKARLIKAISVVAIGVALSASAHAQDSASAPGFWSLLFDKGGLVTWAIALLSAVGLPIAAVKIYQFVQMDIWRPQELDAVLQNYKAGKVQGLATQLEGLVHPAASLLGYAIGEAHGGSLSPALLREELTRRAQFLIRHLARHVWVLELIAASAPLFGLLGTVLGMIVAFQGVGQGAGGADTALLASGIWEALLTTAFGLGVALPFSILAAVINNAVDDVRDMVEDALSDILVRAESI